MLDMTSAEFWLGFGGGAFVTSVFAETIKTIIMEVTKKEFKTIWKTVIALPCAALVAYFFQLYLAAGEPVTWANIPAMTLIYWGTSSIWYNLITKKAGETLRSFGNDT